VGEGGSDLGFFKVGTGTALRGSSVAYTADLAVDADSRVYVAVTVRDSGPDADSEIREHASIHRYDSDGRVGEGELELPGVAGTSLALTDEGRIVIASDAMNLQRRAVAALLEQDGRIVWSQPKIPSSGARSLGVGGVAVDAAGDVFVYTHRSYSKEVKGEFGVVMFDAQGSRIWDHEIAGGFAEAYPSVFGVDGAGNVTVAGYPPSSSGPGGPGDPLRLVHLDVAGEVRWTLDVPAFGIDMSVARNGDIYVAGLDGLARISNEGACERLAWPKENEPRGHTELGPDGRLYFSAWTVGRYRPLADVD
jgi:outer membrane protein assembly factor BamB